MDLQGTLSGSKFLQHNFRKRLVQFLNLTLTILDLITTTSYLLFVFYNIKNNVVHYILMFISTCPRKF